ncbi:hypothetical protein EsH8_I_000156 [Colletotrichum jinshuiense]
MARLGVAKVKTGCITCKIRRVKCDEARPACNRCVGTGRKCDGYVTPPTGAYSWAQLLRVCPPPTVVAPEADLRALSFFRGVVAPVLAGHLDSYFWTHLVSQVSHQEIAAKHAALAISSLYENFKDDPLDRNANKNAFAVAHYNEAIRHLRTTTNQETVLFVCILFVCIDMLRGECKSAVDHCRHGVNILNGLSSRSRFIRDHLEPAFCRLGVFPFFFGVRPETFPVVASQGPAPTAPFERLSQVQASLDPLLVRAIRFVRSADEYRLGDESCPKPDVATIQERDNINAELDAWNASFCTYKEQKVVPNCKGAVVREALVEYLQEMNWLVAKIWIDTCFCRGDSVYDLHMDKFRAIIDIARQADSLLQASRHKIPRPKFTFEMGFSPLLGFVVIKCRSLSLRLAALGLIKTIAHDRENCWDSNTLLAFGRRVIEVEHDLHLGPEEDIEHVIDDGTLPPEGRRIKDSAMQPETRVVPRKDGVVTIWKQISFLMREPNGPVTVRDEMITVQLRREA